MPQGISNRMASRFSSEHQSYDPSQISMQFFMSSHWDISSCSELDSSQQESPYICHRFLIVLSNLINVIFSAHFIVSQYHQMLNDRQGLITYCLYRLHKVKNKIDKLFTEIRLDKLTETEQNRHICKGLLWNQYTDPI